MPSRTCQPLPAPLPPTVTPLSISLRNAFLPVRGLYLLHLLYLPCPEPIPAEPQCFDHVLSSCYENAVNEAERGPQQAALATPHRAQRTLARPRALLQAFSSNKNGQQEKAEALPPPTCTAQPPRYAPQNLKTPPLPTQHPPQQKSMCRRKLPAGLQRLLLPPSSIPPPLLDPPQQDAPLRRPLATPLPPPLSPSTDQRAFPNPSTLLYSSLNQRVAIHFSPSLTVSAVCREKRSSVPLGSADLYQRENESARVCVRKSVCERESACVIESV